MIKKENKTYYFSVEGKTEKWYLEWLQNAINASNSSNYSCLIVSKKCGPAKMVRSVNILYPTEIYNVIDKEIGGIANDTTFKNRLKEMREATKSGKTISYKLAYSNISFELWIILHKIICNSCTCAINDYLSSINSGYSQHFASLDAYKEESNFKNKILKALTINDVIGAINKAEIIIKDKGQTSQVQEYSGYNFYNQNPSLSIHLPIKKILKDFKII